MELLLLLLLTQNATSYTRTPWLMSLLAMEP